MKNYISKLIKAFTLLLVLPNTGFAVTIDDLIKPSQFSQVKISPDGKHLAATFLHGSQTKMAIMSLKDKSIKKVLSFGENNHVTSYHWANNERLLLNKGRKTGAFAIPLGTADIHAINVDGKKKRVVFGPKNGDYGYGRIISLLPDDERHILISSNVEKRQFNDIYKVNIYTGKKKKIQKSPFKNASNLLDNNYVYRFSSYKDNEGNTHVFFRESESDEWEEIDTFTDFKGGKGGITPIAFSEDNKKVYWLENKEKPTQGIYEYDIATKKRKLLFRHNIVDSSPFWLRSSQDPTKSFIAGATFMDGKPQRHYFDETSPSSALLKSLESAFKGFYINITSSTRDNSQLVIYASNDTDPGTYYLFNTQTGQAQHLIKPRSWINPKEMSVMQPIIVEARDGVKLHGYLTIPKASKGKNLPMIVHPHGGPHGPRDEWGFNPEVQFYAAMGYAVLQVNFRGSGGYGREFEGSGYGKWGQEMQDDLTDATLWAIENGVADKERICISGASYGGYASLMGVAKEPDLYKCAFGYVGVYDLPDLFERGNVAERLDWGHSYLKAALGDDPEKLKAISPRFQVDKIKADVFLATGGKDLQAHYKQTFDLKEEFEKRGKEVELLFYKNEGHGFFDPEHNKVLYTKLKAFFEKNIGKGESILK